MEALTPSLWEEMLLEVRRRRPDSVRDWFRDLSAGPIHGGVLEVRAANDAQVRYLDRHCRAAFTEAAQAVTNRLVSTVFVCDRATVPVHRDRPDSSGLREDLTFESLVIGDCNRMAAAAAHVIAERPGEVYNPLFLHGPADSGKTHLLHALGHRAATTNTAAQVLYTTVERFSHDLIESLEDDRLGELRESLEAPAIFVLDGLENLSGRARTQEEVHRLFDARVAANRQLVFASRAAPHELGVETRLKTRFASGLVVSLDLPCYETRLSIARRLTQARGADWGDEVLHLIADQVDGGATAIRALIERVDQQATALRESVTVETVYDALGDDAAHEVRLDAILALVAERFEVPAGEILGPRRSRNVARARQVALYLARTLTPHTLVEIGEFFGDRDHTAALHAVERIERERASSDRFRRLVRDLARALRHSRPRAQP